MVHTNINYMKLNKKNNKTLFKNLRKNCHKIKFMSLFTTYVMNTLTIRYITLFTMNIYKSNYRINLWKLNLLIIQ